MKELISLEKFPSMAAPWSGIDGEGWQWGKFLISVQKNPTTLAEVFSKISGKSISLSLNYHYAALVYYHPDVNPHGKSIRPILCAGIEQIDTNKLAASMSTVLKSTGAIPSQMPVMVGLFDSQAHYNLGEYEGELDFNECRSKLFDVIKTTLDLNGYPNKIGDSQAVRNILSPRSSSEANSNSGCLAFMFLFALIPMGIWSGISLFIN